MFSSLLFIVLVSAAAVHGNPDQPGYCQGDRCVRGSHGAALGEGQSLQSGNGKYTLKMQADGNLVIYKNGDTVMWHTCTDHIAINGGLRFQSDGNLVMYRYDGEAVWKSDTTQTEACKLVLQDDGNLVLYGCYGKVFWASNDNQC